LFAKGNKERSSDQPVTIERLSYDNPLDSSVDADHQSRTGDNECLGGLKEGENVDHNSNHSQEPTPVQHKEHIEDDAFESQLDLGHSDGETHLNLDSGTSEVAQLEEEGADRSVDRQNSEGNQMYKVVWFMENADVSVCKASAST